MAKRFYKIKFKAKKSWQANSTYNYRNFEKGKTYTIRRKLSSTKEATHPKYSSHVKVISVEKTKRKNPSRGYDFGLGKFSMPRLRF